MSFEELGWLTACVLLLVIGARVKGEFYVFCE